MKTRLAGPITLPLLTLLAAGRSWAGTGGEPSLSPVGRVQDLGFRASSAAGDWSAFAGFDALVFSPDGSWLGWIATMDGNQGGAIVTETWGIVWRIGTGKVLRLKNASGTLAFAPDGSRVAAGLFAREAAEWELKSGRRLKVGKRGGGQPVVGYTAAGQKVILPTKGLWISGVAGDGSVAAWVMEKGPRTVNWVRTATGERKSVDLEPGDKSSLGSVALSQDGTCLAVQDGSNVHVVDTRDGKVRQKLSFPDGASSVALSARGGVVAVGREQGGILVRDMRTGGQAQAAGKGGIVRHVAFDPGTTRVAAAVIPEPEMQGGDAEGQVFLWKVQARDSACGGSDAK